jgi:hypothetical protein
MSPLASVACHPPGACMFGQRLVEYLRLQEFRTSGRMGGWNVETKSTEGLDPPVPVSAYTMSPRVSGDPSEVWDFGTLEDLHIEWKRGIQRRSVERRTLPSLKCSMRNEPHRGIGWWMDFHRGCRNLETIRVRWIHVGATWPLTNEAHRTSEGHNF